MGVTSWSRWDFGEVFNNCLDLFLGFFSKSIEVAIGGAIGWAMDEIAFDAVDGQRRGLLDVVDEQEVDGDAGSRP